MPAELRCETNPFESPQTIPASSAQTDVSHTRTQQPDVLATADLLVEQLRDLESLCSAVEERVQRKRHALKELEHLILGSTPTDQSPDGPACPTNTPVTSHLHLVSPRLRGLFDLRGPGRANLGAIQSCLDYSPESQARYNLSSREDPGHSEEWVDEDEEALLCPFDDKYAVHENPPMLEKALPTLPRGKANGVLESRIPKKVAVRRQVSASRKPMGLSSGTVIRSASHRRRSSLRNPKPSNSGLDLKTGGTMRRGSWKRSILENVRTKGDTRAPSTVSENGSVKQGARRREKRKGLWSIYSVYSELGLSGVHRA